MAQVEGVFEAPLQEAIQGSKILVVGAGGIGCELLKNIVLCGKLIFNSGRKRGKKGKGEEEIRSGKRERETDKLMIK